MRIILQQVDNIVDPSIDVLLVCTGSPAPIVKYTTELSYPDWLPVCVPIVVNIRLDTSQVWFVDVNGCEIPAPGQRLPAEIFEPGFVTLVAHGRTAEEGSLFGPRHDHGIPQIDAVGDGHVG